MPWPFPGIRLLALDSRSTLSVRGAFLVFGTELDWLPAQKQKQGNEPSGGLASALQPERQKNSAERQALLKELGQYSPNF